MHFTTGTRAGLHRFVVGVSLLLGAIGSPACGWSGGSSPRSEFDVTGPNGGPVEPNVPDGGSGLDSVEETTTPSGRLTITPATSFASSGPVGGPFAPGSQVYQIENHSISPFIWAAATSAGWVVVSPTSGSIPGGGTQSLTVAIAGPAKNLSAGTYTASLLLKDTSTGFQEDIRDIVLTVTPTSSPGQLSVTPAGGFSSSGPEGGPFAPSSKTYTVANTGGQPIGWVVGTAAPWLLLSKAGGVLAPGAQDTTVVSIDGGVAGGLTPGSYGGQVGFVNTTNGAGDTLRSAALVVTANTIPILLPGSGFSGPTQEPGPNGSGPKVIGKWDVIPHQAFSGILSIGVTAFHVNRVDRVEFSVEGGPWTPVGSMDFNARTGVWEFTALIRAQDFFDGRVEVRAIAYPTSGQPRLLPSLFLTANAGGGVPQTVMWADASGGSDSSGDGSQGNPFQTIFRAAKEIQSRNGSCDNGTVYLKPGSYNYAGKGSQTGTITTTDTWLTVQAAPGVAPSAVTIYTSSSNDALDTRLVRLKDLTNRTKIKSRANQGYKLWFDGVVCHNNGDLLTYVPWASNTEWDGGLYFTDGEVWGTKAGLVNFDFVRNSYLHDLGEDALKQDLFVVNVVVDDVSAPNGSGFHADTYQINSNSQVDNVILYGLKGTNLDAQGIFTRAGNYGYGPHSNIAIVNVLLECILYSGRKSALDRSIDHLLLWNVTMVKDGGGGGYLLMRNDGSVNTVYTDLDIRNCVFEDLQYSATSPSLSDLSWATNNHYIAPSGSTPGSLLTTGNAGFMDEPNDDYRPGPGSVLLGRVPNPLVPGDLFGQPVLPPGSIGTLQPGF